MPFITRDDAIATVYCLWCPAVFTSLCALVGVGVSLVAAYSLGHFTSVHLFDEFGFNYPERELCSYFLMITAILGMITIFYNYLDTRLRMQWLLPDDQLAAPSRFNLFILCIGFLSMGGVVGMGVFPLTGYPEILTNGTNFSIYSNLSCVYKYANSSVCFYFSIIHLIHSIIFYVSALIYMFGRFYLVFKTYEISSKFRFSLFCFLYLILCLLAALFTCILFISFAFFLYFLYSNIQNVSTFTIFHLKIITTTSQYSLFFIYLVFILTFVSKLTNKRIQIVMDERTSYEVSSPQIDMNTSPTKNSIITKFSPQVSNALSLINSNSLAYRPSLSSEILYENEHTTNAITAFNSDTYANIFKETTL